MIYCPECGTANRDGSQFCNNCGARLGPDQGKRCPMCGRSNPQDAEVCQHCQARLTPLRLGESVEADGEAREEAQAPEVFGELEPEDESPETGEEPVSAEPANWLQRLRQSAMGATGDEETPEVFSEEDEDEIDAHAVAPEWLLGADEGVEALVGQDAAAGDDALTIGSEEGPTPLPDWLEDLVASDQGQSITPLEEEPIADQGAPIWLHGIEADEGEPVFAVDAQDELGASWAESGEEDGLAATSQAEIGDEVVGPDEAGQPDWLFDDEDSRPPALSVEEDAFEGLVPGDVLEPELEQQGEDGFDVEAFVAGDDSWSSPEIEVEASEASHAFEPDWEQEAAEEPVVPEEAEIPDWLRDLATPVQEMVAEQPEIADLASEPEASEEKLLEPSEGQEASDADIPDWLRDLAPARAEAGEGETVQGLAEAEIPNWLADLRPAPSIEAPVEPDERAEEGQGVLAGIAGVLPVESVWRSPQRAQAMPMPPALTAEEQAAELFADILAGQPEERATSVREEPGFVSRGVTRLVIYLILALAVLVPLFFGADWFSTSIQVPDPTWALWDVVNALPAESNVVMAFDYDPSVAAELDLQAIALLRHLMEKKSRVYALSMVPQGPALAQGVWDTVSHGDGSQYGRDFLNLGYLSGQESGLRLLARGLGAAFTQDYFQRSIANDVMLQRVQRLQDVSLIVVLSVDQGSVRRWLEQVQSAYPVKTVAGVAAIAGPSVAPYYYSGQLSGLLVGMSGAAEYEIAMNQPHIAVSSLGAQSLAHLAIIFIILLGNLTALANRMRQRK